MDNTDTISKYCWACHTVINSIEQECPKCGNSDLEICDD